jgi:hypothetical protein
MDIYMGALTSSLTTSSTLSFETPVPRSLHKVKASSFAFCSIVRADLGVYAFGVCVCMYVLGACRDGVVRMTI